MLELEKLLWRKSAKYREPTVHEQRRAQAFFEDWRDRYITALAWSIRFQRVLQEFNRPEVKSLPASDWSNAAIHLLTVPSETVQDYFLRSPLKEKNEIVQAVLRDGGIRSSNGTFIKLPPL